MKICSFLAALFLVSTCVAHGEEPTVVTWSPGAAGHPPLVGENKISHVAGGTEPNTVVLVDAASPVPNPFPAIERALLIQQGGRAEDEKGESAIVTFALADTPLTKGTLKMNFLLLPSSQADRQSGFNIVLAPQASDSLSKGDLTKGLVRLRLTGNAGTQICIPASDLEGIGCEPRSQPEVPSEVRIDWDLTQKPGFCTVHLNGQPVRDKKQPAGEATRFPIPDTHGDGIGALMLMPRTTTSGYVIGRIEMGESVP